MINEYFMQYLQKKIDVPNIMHLAGGGRRIAWLQGQPGLQVRRNKSGQAEAGGLHRSKDSLGYK